MTRLETALIEVVAILNESKIPYMLIGGLAVAQWGEPRATLDVDVTVWVDGTRPVRQRDRRPDIPLAGSN